MILSTSKVKAGITAYSVFLKHFQLALWYDICELINNTVTKLYAHSRGSFVKTFSPWLFGTSDWLNDVRDEWECKTFVGLVSDGGILGTDWSETLLGDIDKDAFHGFA